MKADGFQVKLPLAIAALAVGVGLLVARVYVTWGVWHPHPLFRKQALIPPAMLALLVGAVLLDEIDRDGRSGGFGWAGITAAGVAVVGMIHYLGGILGFLALVLFATGLAAALVPPDPDRTDLRRDVPMAAAAAGVLIAGQDLPRLVGDGLGAVVVRLGVFAAVLGIANLVVLLRRPNRSGETLGRMGLANAAAGAVLFAMTPAGQRVLWVSFFVVAIPLAVVADKRGPSYLGAPLLGLVLLLVWVHLQIVAYIPDPVTS